MHEAAEIRHILDERQKEECKAIPGKQTPGIPALPENPKKHTFRGEKGQKTPGALLKGHEKGI